LQVAKLLLQGLSKIARQPTVNALIKGLSRDERINMTADVLSTVPLGDMLQLIHVRASEMAPDDRTALVSTVLDTVSQNERAQVVQESLVAMGNDERAALLGSVFGLMTSYQRDEIAEKLAKVTMSVES
jgi:hypothetical protein